MANVRTLTMTPGPNIKRTANTITSRVEYSDAGVYYAFNRSQRPLYTFELELGPLSESEVQCLSALHALHQGGRSFFWDGGRWGTMENYQIFGEADGVRTSYFLPNRYVGAGSIAVQSFRPSTGANSNWTTAYSLTPNAGVVTFTTAPVSGDDLLAKYGCKYRVNFEPEQLVTEEVAAGLYKISLRLIESGLTT